MTIIISEAKKELINYIINYSNLILTAQPPSSFNKLIVILDFYQSIKPKHLNNINSVEIFETLLNSIEKPSYDFYHTFQIKPLKVDKYYKSFLCDLVDYISKENNQEKYNHKIQFFLFNLLVPNNSAHIHVLSDIIDFIGLESINKLLKNEKDNNLKGLFYSAKNYMGKKFINSISKQCKKDNLESKVNFLQYILNSPTINNNKFSEQYINKFIINFLHNDNPSLIKVAQFYPPLQQHFDNLNSKNVLTNSVFQANLSTIYLDISMLNSFALDNHYHGNTGSLLTIINNNFNDNSLIKEKFNIKSSKLYLSQENFKIILECNDKPNFDKDKFQTILLKLINECIYGKAISNKNNEIDKYINKIILDELLDKPNSSKTSNKVKI